MAGSVNLTLLTYDLGLEIIGLVMSSLLDLHTPIYAADFSCEPDPCAPCNQISEPQTNQASNCMQSPTGKVPQPMGVME